MKKIVLILILLSFTAIQAQELKPNYSEKGKLLLQQLNETKDTLTLKSNYPMTYIYVIDRSKATIHEVYAKEFKICIKDWTHERHTIAVRLLGDIIALNIDYDK